MKKLLALLLLFPFVVAAAPFLTCDPYPNTGPQPTEFVVTITGVTQPIVTPAVAVTGGKAMMLDLGPLNLNGERTFTARARNASSESASSQPFTAWMGTLLLPPPNNLQFVDAAPVVRYLGLEPGTATDVRMQGGNSWDLIRAVAATTFTATHLGARVHTGGDGGFRLAVFGALANGEPNVASGPLAYVDQIFNATSGVHEGVLTQPVQITAGSVYWLGAGAWRPSVAVTWAANNNAGVRWRRAGAISADTPPGAWPTSGFSYSADTTYEIYLFGPSP